MNDDENDGLQRFVAAQQGSYDTALAELRAGAKRTHWMWYVLPQLRGLGASGMAQRYGIASLAEARAYLAHPLLGARLRDCVAAVRAHRGTPAARILGEVDALKFRSCLTLFREAAEGDDAAPFAAALDEFYGGRPDPRTLALLGR